MMIRGPFMYIHPPMKPKGQSPQDKIKRDLRKDFPSRPFPRRYLEDNDVPRGAIVKGINSRRLGEKGGREAARKWARPAQDFSKASRPPLRPRVSWGYLKTPPQGSSRDQFARRRQGAEKIEGHLSESRGSC